MALLEVFMFGEVASEHTIIASDQGFLVAS